MIKAMLRIRNPLGNGFILPGETAVLDESIEKSLVESEIAVFTTEQGETHHGSCGLSTSDTANGVSSESKETQNDNFTRIDELTAEVEELKATSLKNLEESRKQIGDLTTANEVLVAVNDLLKKENEELKHRVKALEGSAKASAKTGAKAVNS